MESSCRKPERGLLLISNLPALQNLVKRDPIGYAAEFATQWDQYQSLLSVIHLGLGTPAGGNLTAPASTNHGSCGGSGKSRRDTEDRFREIVGFLAQTAPCYAANTKPVRPVKIFPKELSALLLEKHDRLHIDTRKTLIQALVGLRRKDTTNCMITNLELLHVLFALLPITTSSTLRASILKTILTDIKLANKKTKNHKLNRSIQGLLFNMVESGIVINSAGVGDAVEGTGLRRRNKKLQSSDAKASGREAMWAVKLTAELWRKGIWTDSKSIQILADACFHSNSKVQSAAIHFFLADSAPSMSLDGVDSDADEPENIDIRQVKHVQTINKKKKSTEKRAEKKIKQANKLLRAKQAGVSRPNPSCSALQLIQDPQKLGEQLYEALLRNDKSYTLTHKILLIRLFARISAAHKLQVLPFYFYILKFITHHQLEVTSILAALAESVHELTPPDVLIPCLRKLANEFVHPGVASTVIAAGLNSITEISRRQPLAMEADLLADLVEYKKSKDKGVIAASRSLLGLFREVNSSILKTRERGKKAAMDQQKARKGIEPSDLASGLGYKPIRYGEIRGEVSTIAGLDLLEQNLGDTSMNSQPIEGEDEDPEGWELESIYSDSSSSKESDNGWIDVSSDEDGEELELSDSDSDADDQEPGDKKRKESRRVRMQKRRKIDTGGWKAGEDTRQPKEDRDDDGGEEDDLAESQYTTDQPSSTANKPISESLAATRILTPADFAKLNELRIKAIEEAAKATGSKNMNSSHQKLLKQLRKQAHLDPNNLSALESADSLDRSNFVSEGDIIGQQKKAKQDYEERMASIQSGREGREKFGSSKVRGRKGLKNGATGSSTNEAKSRQKAFAMTQQSNRVRSKKGASLRDRQKTLRAHIDRKKRGGRRGNG